MSRDPRRRFSDRVADYVRARPGYPDELVPLLVREFGLAPHHEIVDVGCGTGKLAEPFLRHGHRVIGVEPNDEMREAGRQQLEEGGTFRPVAGSAEATGLADGSVDWIVAGQAFHWFDVDASRREFLRILRPGGRVLLVWNDRDVEATPFMRDYEALLDRYGTDYHAVNHQRYDDEALARFFGPPGFETRFLELRQQFDHDGLRARLLSSSYSPAPGEPAHRPMMAALRALFDREENSGRVDFLYRTRVLVGAPG